MFGPAGRSSGVPLVVWAGKLIFSGTVSAALRLAKLTARNENAIVSDKTFVIRILILCRIEQETNQKTGSFRSENEPVVIQLDFPTFAVFAFHEACGFRVVRGAHVRSVPFELVADPTAEGDATEENAFGEISADI